MIKIWLLLMLVSMPNQPSVKYQALVYPTEDQCIVARDGYMKSYEEKPLEYKLTLKTKAYCIPFDSFPISGMPSPVGA
jgi:hypothetical protein